MKARSPSNSDSLFLSTTEAAARCNVSPETIRRWIRTKGLPAYNTSLGLNIRIRLSDLEEFAHQNNILLAEPPADMLGDTSTEIDAVAPDQHSSAFDQPGSASLA